MERNFDIIFILSLIILVTLNRVKMIGRVTHHVLHRTARPEDEGVVKIGPSWRVKRLGSLTEHRQELYTKLLS